MLLLTFLLGILFSMRLIVLASAYWFRDGYRRAFGDSADTSLSLVRSTIYPSGYFIDFASKVSADEIVSYWIGSEWISRQLVIGPIYSLYQSAYLSLEIGKLFHEGFELRQIIVLLEGDETRKSDSTPCFQDDTRIRGRYTISLIQFQNYHFLSEEFSKIILQGEAKGNLGKELIFYSEWTRKTAFQTTSALAAFYSANYFLVLKRL